MFWPVYERILASEALQTISLLFDSVSFGFYWRYRQVFYWLTFFTGMRMQWLFSILICFCLLLYQLALVSNYCIYDGLPKCNWLQDDSFPIQYSGALEFPKFLALINRLLYWSVLLTHFSWLNQWFFLVNWAFPGSTGLPYPFKTLKPRPLSPGPLTSSEFHLEISKYH